MLGKIWRTLLVIGLGLGLTWAAGRSGFSRDSLTAGTAFSRDPPSMLQLDEGRPAEPAEPAEVPAAGAVEELSAAEIEAELKNVENVLSGGPDPGEVVAEKPLPADLGVSLPSDI
jgi:hypothetical protein